MGKAITAVALLLLSGCVHNGVKITEGTDLTIGITVPGTEGVLQLQVLNYLSGFSVYAESGVAVEVDYTMSATNSYFGVVKTEQAKSVRSKFTPVERAVDSCVE